MDMNTALTIGASDCSGGAGVGADLKAFTVLGVYGMGVVTAVVAWNTQGARGHELVDERIVTAQIAGIGEDLPVGAFKTGYLGTARLVSTVANAVQRAALDKYVCDPVIEEQYGIQPESSLVHAYRKELLPLATVVTPNKAAAALLSNMDEGDVGTLSGAKKAAEKIVKTGARSVVVKGLLTVDRVIDLFYDGDQFIEFPAKRLTTKNTYGAGSLFSAVITAMLAQEMELPTAVDHARSFVSQAIEHHVKLGSGVRPVNVLALTPV
jgi:hydroxymethylpyrimidine/phosphomethylpyrimidine kinase